MVVDPATAMLVATAIGAGAKAGSDYLGSKKEKKAGRHRAKETKRETYAGLIQDALQREAELEGHRLSSRNKLGKRKAQSMQETADLVRGAFNS